MEHTKGPWTTTGHFVYGPNDEEIAELNDAGNGYIIAAAPDLLKALMDLRSFLWSVGYADQTVSMAQADAAISKAEGRS